MPLIIHTEMQVILIYSYATFFTVNASRKSIESQKFFYMRMILRIAGYCLHPPLEV
jgi:hypothetical protein